MNKNDELFMSTLVLSTHEDCDVIETVEVGYNEQFELVIRLSERSYGWVAEDLDDAECYIEVRTDFDNAYALSRRLDTPMRRLHYRVAACLGNDYDGLILPSADDTWTAFRRITDFISQNGCKYKLKYKYGRGHYPDGCTFRYNRWRG